MSRLSLFRGRSDLPRNTRGSAAVEFAVWIGALAVPTFSAVDIGFYGFQTLQVHNAAQMAAQAAWAACNTSALQPATANCGGSGATLNTAIWRGEQSTPLGARVTLASDSASTPSREQFWCINSSGKVTLATGATSGKIATNSGDVDTSGNDTAAAVNSATCAYGASGSATPGDYVIVTVQYTYHPIFKALSVVNLLNGGNAKITQTAWTRIA